MIGKWLYALTALLCIAIVLSHDATIAGGWLVASHSLINVLERVAAFERCTTRALRGANPCWPRMALILPTPLIVSDDTTRASIKGSVTVGPKGSSRGTTSTESCGLVCLRNDITEAFLSSKEYIMVARVFLASNLSLIIPTTSVPPRRQLPAAKVNSFRWPL
jgi:hypothetical protein